MHDGTLVVKFGGTSLGSINLMRRAADIVLKHQSRYANIVVVVSAMGNQTDFLLELLDEAVPMPNLRELDVVASTGELISAALFASLLQAKGVASRSLSGAQACIATDNQHGSAQIINIDVRRISELLDQGEIPVVAGYQGVNSLGEVTTLGRGGSDTTAAALGVALQATKCLIYTDVRGVYSADPRICPDARLLNDIHYKEMLELAALGAKILHPRAVQFAGRNQLAMEILSTFDEASSGTNIIFTKEYDMEQPQVTGITYNLEEAKITLRSVPDRPGVAAELFCAIAEHGIDVDVIVQNIGADGHADISFTIHRDQLERATKPLNDIAAKLNCKAVETTTNVAKLSIVGVGMRGHAGIAAQMFKSLAETKVNILMISTSEIKLSAIIDESYVLDVVRKLHSDFGLEAKEQIKAVSSEAVDG